MHRFKRIEEIMVSQNFSSAEIVLFRDMYIRYISREKTDINWSEISSPTGKSIIDYSKLETPGRRQSKELLSQLAVCKLNGGLGTSMGCVGPKSTIVVKDGKSFLDLIVAQIQVLNGEFDTDVPLILMNSFNTDQDTKKVVQKYNGQLDIITFQQNRFPRLRRDSLLPLVKVSREETASYPPGHGDLFFSIMQFGILDRLIDQGKRYLYVANADNLGASVDLRILSLLSKAKAPYIMEVTDKTRADVKGGTLVKTKKSALRLLEIAQVPDQYKEEFKSVKKFKIFNTNNIWMDLIALKEKLQNDALCLDLIVNHKIVDRIPVIQLESTIGSGINSFQGSLAIRVPRIRFLPVKKTNDLLLVQSNLFIEKDGMLRKNPDRQFDGIPLVRLGDCFGTVQEYQERFGTIPDILELDLLTVVGNVHFGKHITLKGNVILVCDGDELHIPHNAVLENKVLTGHIQIGEL